MKKTYAFLLAVLCLLPYAVSCADESSDAVVTQTQEAVTETGTAALTNEDMLTAYLDTLPEKDYGGYEFIILTRSEESWAWFTRDVFSAGENGDAINDAVYKRNMLLQDKFNIVVKDNPISQLPAIDARRFIMADDDCFAFVTDGLTHLAKLAIAGLAIDYHTVDAIHLDNVWWDQRMNTDMSIMNELYTITGDISIMDNEGTWHMLFNKQIHADYDLQDYYEMRDNGTWTLDVLIEDAKKVVSDLNGDGVMSAFDGDRFGFATEVYNTFQLWAGTGMKTVTKNEHDIPVYTMYNERSQAIVERILDIQLDKNVTFNHNDINNFADAQTALFQLVGMRVLPTYRQCDTEFGILPLPKFDVADEYTSIGSFDNLTAYLMPVTTGDVERSGILLEAMAGISYYTLSPAYYDLSLEGKYIRDEESRRSIDIILSRRSYDLGAIFGFGKPAPVDLFMTMTERGKRDFASRCESQRKSMDAAIEDFIQSIEESDT